MNMISKASAHILELHKDQKRKVSGLPYVVHPFAVASNVLRYNYKSNKYSVETLYTTALLHDTVEDCGVTFEEIEKLYGKQVKDLVYELTNDKDEIAKYKKEIEESNHEVKDAKTLYLINKLPKLSEEALYIKLCDRLDNMQSNPMDDYKKNTCIFISSLLKSETKIPITHAGVVNEIMKYC